MKTVLDMKTLLDLYAFGDQKLALDEQYRAFPDEHQFVVSAYIAHQTTGEQVHLAQSVVESPSHVKKTRNSPREQKRLQAIYSTCGIEPFTAKKALEVLIPELAEKPKAVYSFLHRAVQRGFLKLVVGDYCVTSQFLDSI